MQNLIIARCSLARRAPRRTRTFVSSITNRNSENASKPGVREELRALLQHTAQPVSVLTVKSATEDEAYHGATLSSFSSISFHPFPIISFALQLPSRSADALQSHFSQGFHPAQSQSQSHFVINILSSTQSHIAIRFSRPDLYPKPFLDADPSSTSTPYAPAPTYTLTKEGIPMFDNSLGALSCSLLSSLPLGAASDPHALARAMEVHALPPREETLPGSSPSMLYLARVVRVEDPTGKRSAVERAEEDWPMPLVYHRRAYGTVEPLRDS